MSRQDYHFPRDLENRDDSPSLDDLNAGPDLNAPRNSVTVESPYGLRTFALRDGDVTLSSDPVMVIPTHANSDYRPTGQVLSLAEERYGIDFTNIEKVVSGRLGTVGTYRLREKGKFAGNEVLLVRIAGKFTADRQ